MMIMIVPLRTKPSGLYRHWRGLGFTQSRLQRRKSNIRITKLIFHAKESPIQTRDEVLSLASSRSNSPDKVYSPAVWIPPNLGLPQDSWPNYVQLEWEADDEEIRCPPTTHLVATVDDLTDMLDFDSEDIDGMDDDAGEE